MHFKKNDKLINLIQKQGKKDKAIKLFSCFKRKVRLFFKDEGTFKINHYALDELSFLLKRLFLLRSRFRFKSKKIARKKVLIPIYLKALRSKNLVLRILLKLSVEKKTNRLNLEKFSQECLKILKKSDDSEFLTFRHAEHETLLINKSNRRFLRKKKKRTKSLFYF